MIRFGNDLKSPLISPKTETDGKNRFLPVWMVRSESSVGLNNPGAVSFLFFFLMSSFFCNKKCCLSNYAKSFNVMSGLDWRTCIICSSSFQPPLAIEHAVKVIKMSILSKNITTQCNSPFNCDNIKFIIIS